MADGDALSRVDDWIDPLSMPLPDGQPAVHVVTDADVFDVADPPRRMEIVRSAAPLGAASAAGGVWVVYAADLPVSLHAEEIDALREAVAERGDVRFVAYGGSLR